jgi:hypothetical protein
MTLLERRGEWDVVSRGGCTVEVHRPGTNRAEWELNPEIQTRPTDGTVSLLILENACASGIDPRPRLETPEVVYDDTSITIALFVRWPAGGPKAVFTCIGPPPVPIAVELEEPVGNRELIDGAVYPPQPPELSY